MLFAARRDEKRLGVGVADGGGGGGEDLRENLRRRRGV
jgi:hypothetical protein